MAIALSKNGVIIIIIREICLSFGFCFAFPGRLFFVVSPSTVLPCSLTQCSDFRPGLVCFSSRIFARFYRHALLHFHLAVGLSAAMAERLASIYGTERDQANCPFYLKIGACRHGDRCSRSHNKPLFSPTLLFTNMYISPTQIRERAATLGLAPPRIPADEEAAHFDDFYEDMHSEMSRHGRVDNINICENRSEHLQGNTYVRFEDEDGARAALDAVQGRVYAGRAIKVEYSPVTELADGRCRKFEETNCERGDFCHFMHARKLGSEMHRRLYGKRQRAASGGDDEADRRGMGSGPGWGRDREFGRDKGGRSGERDRGGRDYRDYDRGGRDYRDRGRNDRYGGREYKREAYVDRGGEGGHYNGRR